MSCEPGYSYRPTFITGSHCTAQLFVEHRSRVTVGTAPTSLFFRSRYFGSGTNQITIECVSSPAARVNVYNNSILHSSYVVTLAPGGIANLRTQITNDINSIVDMPPLGYDIYDTRIHEYDQNDPLAIPPITNAGLHVFSLSSLSGGQGGPTDASGLASIVTGPERSMIIIVATEDDQGDDATPPPSRRIQQWNGSQWISYCNLVQGNCPLDGTC